MHAVILDIDGTLIDSAAIENRLYMSAVGKVLGRVRLRDDWTTYTNVTDAGLLAEIMADNGFAPDDALMREVRTCFLDKLRHHLDVHGPFAEMPGAKRFVEGLLKNPNVKVAYATGAWERSARTKLERSGFPLSPVPLVSSDHHVDRPAIMRSALNRLEGPFDRVSYFGDGLWDAKAAAGLGWHFIAVGPRLGGIKDFDNVQIDGR